MHTTLLVNPIQSLEQILNLSTIANDSITNLSTLEFLPISGNNLILQSDPSGNNVLKINTTVNRDLTKTFSTYYLPIRIGNTLYYIQLFV